MRACYVPNRWSTQSAHAFLTAYPGGKDPVQIATDTRDRNTSFTTLTCGTCEWLWVNRPASVDFCIGVQEAAWWNWDVDRREHSSRDNFYMSEWPQDVAYVHKRRGHVLFVEYPFKPGSPKLLVTIEAPPPIEIPF